MIVISAGLPRSGSGWIFNLTNELMVAAGHQNVHDVRKRYGLGRIMAAHNCNVGRAGLFKLAALGVPHLMGNSFVVKTHRKPTATLRRAMAMGLAKCTYIFRDPRDVLLSAMEEGQRMRNRGVSRAFARIQTVEDALEEVKGWLRTWDSWTADDRTLHVRYEQLREDPIGQSQRMIEFLGIHVPQDSLRDVVEKFKPGNKVTGAHFVQGVVGRFRDVLTAEQVEQCNQQLSTYLQRMGYEVN